MMNHYDLTVAMNHCEPFQMDKAIQNRNLGMARCTICHVCSIHPIYEDS